MYSSQRTILLFSRLYNITMITIIQKNKIKYEDKGKGIPIVFLPGITGNADIWNNQLEHLSLYYRVITVDFSEININSISTHSLLSILKDLTIELNLNLFYIIGYSVGGLIALQFANRNPDCIIGVVTTSLGNISASTNEVVKFYKKNFRPTKNIIRYFIDKLLGKRDYSFDIAYKFASLIKYYSIINEYSKLQLPLLIINGEFDHLSCHNISQNIYNKKKNNRISLDVIEQARKDCFNTNPILYDQILLNYFINNGHY